MGYRLFRRPLILLLFFIVFGIVGFVVLCFVCLKLVGLWARGFVVLWVCVSVCVVCVFVYVYVRLCVCMFG